RVELGGLPSAEREEAALRRAAAEAGRPFDLARGPLARATLLRLEARDHLLVVVMHHAISEGGWSRAVFRRELEALYGAFSRGEPSPLAEPAVHFADFA